jgi:hypothetical protein
VVLIACCYAGMIRKVHYDRKGFFKGYHWISGLMHHNVHVFSCLYIVARTLQKFTISKSSSPVQSSLAERNLITSPPA